MPKDKAYWQVYNQKRKTYLAAKKKASRERLKLLNSPCLITPKKVIDHQTTDTLHRVVDLKHQSTETLKVAEQVVDTQVVVDQASLKIVDCQTVVDNRSWVVDINQTANHQAVVDNSFQVVDNLSHLIHLYQTNTAYNCASTCSQNKYCSNCWYFEKDSLLDYKTWSFAG